MTDEEHTVTLTFKRDDHLYALLVGWISTEEHGNLSCGAGVGSPFLTYDRTTADGHERWVADMGDVFRQIEKATRTRINDPHAASPKEDE